ncbi:NACHT, LRR and PYD domains-containing protein 3-like [Hypanus sabinus]|uniref:NACHT, LRR and PYD domains-containing protein 3-like n=1 Tax=Hypanus sabinus TaxID=79690 RepID=UPI0028C42152|nr:NACHT, LRR and PYD domains-containing protein 3-like [Hypanus sabinus]
MKHFDDQTVAAAVFKHVKENEILYTMSYNPSYCWILALALGPFFTQRDRDPQQIPKTINQLYSYYIYSILKNHSREIENPRDVLLRVGQMAFRGVSEKRTVFTDGDLNNYNLQPSQILSGFLMELLGREDSAQCVVYTFPHLTIQEFAAAVAQFLTIHPEDILKFLTEVHNTTDGRFEVFLRFVAGLSSPMTARGLEEFLGPFPHETTCRVMDWVKEEVKRQSGNTSSEAGKRRLLNTFHYLFESQNRELAQTALGSVEELSFSGMTLIPVDCAVLSHVVRLCDTIKRLDLLYCHILCEGIQQLGPWLHKFQVLSLGRNDLGDSGVKLVSAALGNPECKIQTLNLNHVELTDSGAEDLASALSTNRSLIELDLGWNPLTDQSVPAIRRLILTHPSLEQIISNSQGFRNDPGSAVIWDTDLKCDLIIISSVMQSDINQLAIAIFSRDRRIFSAKKIRMVLPGSDGKDDKDPEMENRMKSVVLLFSITVNAPTIVILSRGKCGRSKTVTRYLLAMSASDIAVVFLDVILMKIPKAFPDDFPFLFYVRVCRTHVFLMQAATDCSVWFTVAFTFDRFEAFCFQDLLPNPGPNAFPPGKQHFTCGSAVVICCVWCPWCGLLYIGETSDKRNLISSSTIAAA